MRPRSQSSSEQGDAVTNSLILDRRHGAAARTATRVAFTAAATDDHTRSNVLNASPGAAAPSLRAVYCYSPGALSKWSGPIAHCH